MIARAHKATGDPMAALVLLRIAFWFAKAKASGREATAQSVADLMHETAGTEKQVKRVLVLLRERGLVESRRAFFAGKNVNHWTITEKGQQALEGPFEQSLEGPFEEALKGPFYIHGETTGSDYMENGEPGLAGCNSDSGEELNMPPKKSGPMSVKDILMSAKVDASAGKKLHQPDSPKALERVWQKSVSETFDKYVAPLTLKQLGQLRNFAKKCPSGLEPSKILRHAVENWIGFVKAVEVEAGIKKTPAEPSIDFLLKHAGIAVNLALDSKSSPTAKQEAPAMEKPHGKPVQLISQPGDEKPKTLDELMAILNADDGDGA